jgi:polyisoprenoid-binding protein YceI
MIRTLLSAALIWTGVTGNLAAQTISPDQMGKPEPSRIVAGTYNLDPMHTHIIYKVDHFGLSSYYGMFGSLEGKLTIDPKKPQDSSVSVTIPIDKIQSTTPPLDAHLKTEDFFDSGKYPEARFRSTKIDVSGNTAKFTGELTIRDKTKTVELEGRFVGAAVHPMSELLNVGFEATGTIKRSDFGINYLVPFVSDEVALTITAVFEKVE